MIAKPRGMTSTRFGLIALAGAFFTIGAASVARAGLDEYVKKPDSAFGWTQTGNHNTPAGAVIGLKLTSQTWQGITWKHNLRIYEPREIAYPDAMLLFITGGANDDREASDDDHKQAFGLARLCGRGLRCCRKCRTSPFWMARPRMS